MSKTQRPNVLWIMTEEQRADSCPDGTEGKSSYQ